MTINVTYSQFLFSNGVLREQADAVGARIATKIWKREPLTQEEIALTAAYLKRPGANEIAERHVGAAILTSNLRDTVDQQSTSDLPVIPNASVLGFSNVMVGAGSRSAGRIPAHTPEWRNLRPGDPGSTAVSVQGSSDKTKPQIEFGAGPSDVRKLTAQVAASFASAGSGTPTV